MKPQRLLPALMIGLGLALTLMTALNRTHISRASPDFITHDNAASAAELHVCTAGCLYSSVQAAVDAAQPGNVVKVATGVYTGVSARKGVTQVVYLNKTVTLRGGYTTAFTDPSDPAANPTTLDAQGQGRVLYITGDIAPTIEGLRFTNGDAIGLGGLPDDPSWTEGFGGGVYIVTATATISHCQLISNTADDGGGLAAFFGVTTLKDNTFESNTATYGGGVYLSSGSAILNGNTLFTNTVTAAGGGLYATWSDITLDGDVALSNTAQSDGGGLCLDRSTARLDRIQIAHNTGREGGGLFSDSGDLTLTDSVVTANTARREGGGLYASGFGYRAELIGNTFSGNQADIVACPSTGVGGGGGIVLFNPGDATVQDNLVVNNRAPNGSGGGLSLGSRYGTSIVRHNTVISNSAEYYGGGVYVDNGSATLDDNTVSGNSTTLTGFDGQELLWGGGGVYASYSDVTLRSNAVLSNATAGNGGGLYLNNCNSALDFNTVAGNTALVGGGVTVYAGTARLNATTVVGNRARYILSNTGYGGGLYLKGSDAALTNTLVADNSADRAGSGVYADGPGYCLVHTTVARNTGAEGSGVYVHQRFATWPSTVAMTDTILVSQTVGITVTAGNTATLDATLWGAGDWRNWRDWGGNAITGTPAHNYWGDPAFVAPSTRDYHIGPTSPAIDRGVNANADSDWDNQPRPNPDTALPDLGADEYWPCMDINEVGLIGPVTGTVNTPITFTASFTPFGGTPNLFYTWLPEPRAGQWTAQAVYTFAAASTYTIKLSARNCGGTGSASWNIAISAGPKYSIYLPLVIRNSSVRPEGF